MFENCISEKLIKDIFESMHAEIYKSYKLTSLQVKRAGCKLLVFI